MTIDEARACLGRRVVYDMPGVVKDEGVITNAGRRYAFVRYDGDTASKATDPAYLTLAPEAEGGT